MKECSSTGRAPVSKTGGCGFESLRSCQKKVMKNPLKFIQEVKQETFRVTWPTKKDTMMGALMVFGLASIAAIFFLILDQILRFLLNLVLTINF